MKTDDLNEKLNDNQDMEKLPEAKEEKRRQTKHFIGMLIIGALNNLPYWVALSSAQTIVLHFNSAGLLGAVTWGCVLLGMAATSTNAFLSSKNVSYNVRSIINGLFMGLGLIGTAFAPNIYFAIFCIIFVGLSSDFGEGVMLGYFASIGDDSLMSAWGIGTGISGMLGSGYAFLSQLFNFSYFVSFMALSPSGIIYPLAFIFLLDAKTPPKKAISDRSKIDKNSDSQHGQSIDDNNEIEVEEIDHDEAEANSVKELDIIPEDGKFKSIETNGNPTADEKVRCCTLKLWKYAFYFFINNGLTFFFQYVSISGISDCSMTKQEKIDKPYLYSLLNLIYQVGNFFGRATLRWMKIKRIWLLTLIQGLLMVFLFINVVFRFLPFYGMIISMFVIGLNSGFSYVNIFNQTMNYPPATPKEREIITNLTTISIAGFIVLSSAFTLLYQNTFLKEQCIG